MPFRPQFSCNVTLCQIQHRYRDSSALLRYPPRCAYEHMEVLLSAYPRHSVAMRWGLVAYAQSHSNGTSLRGEFWTRARACILIRGSYWVYVASALRRTSVSTRGTKSSVPYLRRTHMHLRRMRGPGPELLSGSLGPGHQPRQSSIIRRSPLTVTPINWGVHVSKLVSGALPLENKA
jgi:hypothetical protein